MGFATGFVIVNNLKRRVLRRPDLIARYYIMHSTFFVDMLTLVPVIAEVHAPLFASGHLLVKYDSCSLKTASLSC